MPLSVEQCKHFDNNICTKCGRMMPDMCKEQEELENKARMFDELMAAKATTTTIVEEPPKPLVKKVMLPKGK